MNKQQTGMTLKQMAISRYLKAVQAYKDAIKNKDSRGLIIASLAIMSTKGDVPKKYWRLSRYKALTT